MLRRLSERTSSQMLCRLVALPPGHRAELSCLPVKPNAELPWLDWQIAEWLQCCVACPEEHPAKCCVAKMLCPPALSPHASQICCRAARLSSQKVGCVHALLLLCSIQSFLLALMPLASMMLTAHWLGSLVSGCFNAHLHACFPFDTAAHPKPHCLPCCRSPCQH
jgi:hypothetical protein